jgi:CMP/dCMP kinase
LIQPPDNQRPFLVAIDGPSAAGKTTVGTMVAERLNAAFLDTGVLYRVLTLCAQEQGIAPEDEEALAEFAAKLDVVVQPPSADDGRLADVFVEGRDVTWAIRTPEVDAHVSQVASHPHVRQALIPAQRRAAESTSAVVVGRDIGTVILPDAQVKIYLDATALERARRRAQQLGADADLAEVTRAIERRDELDRSRSTAPLEQAPDAVVVDTDGVPAEDVVERIVAIVHERTGQA